MKRLKLHTKFAVLLIAVSLIPLIAVSLFTLARFQISLRADASKLGEQIAATASAQIQTFLVLQFGVLDNIASVYNPGFPIKKDVAAQILETILLKSENFMDISVVDRDGKEIVRKNRLLVMSENDFRDMSTSTAYLGVRERGIHIGSVYVDGGRSFFNVGRKIVDNNGAFAGAIFAQVNAQVMPSVVEDISRIVGAPGRVYIVNEKGIVIAHPNLSYMLSERDLSALPPVQNIVAHPDQVPPPTIYTNELGQSVLGAAYPMTIQIFENSGSTSPSINWFVVAEQPEARVYAEAGRAALLSTIIFFVGIVLAASAAIFFAGRIARPIEALHTAAIEFGKGNLGYRAHVKTGDEIEDLADSFNATAETLEHTVASLESEEHVTAVERDKLRVILSGITNAVIAVNMRREIILFNTAAEALTGVTTESVLGKQFGDVVRIFAHEKEVPATVLCSVQEHAPEGIIYKENGLMMKDSGGVEHFVNVVSGRIREGESIDLGCVLTFQDVTREFVLERTKREFVSIAAHQLRTPLTGLSWAMEALISGAKGVLNAAQKELVEHEHSTVVGMIDLVDGLLNVSRIEEGRFGITSTHQSIQPVLMRVLESFKRVAQERGVVLNTEISDEVPEFDFDANKIEFVIGNILDNAIKYTPTGGSALLRLAKADGNAVISVRDTGIGISKEDYGRIFTKFFRSSDASSRFPDGSGLGLYVAKNVVDQHGGKIWFGSEGGQGTIFTISLPLSRLPLSGPSVDTAYTQPPSEVA